ncbi:MAG: D-glycerate dehydrogenase [Chloroflexi bacterium]|nr:MAG: D-glycerate dehydrogenase [Chloroflexota bacterium]
MTRPKVFITRRLPDEARSLVAAVCEVAEWPDGDQPIPRADLLRQVAEADGILTLLTERVDAELLDAAPHCRVVANMAVGYDNIDVAELTRRGVLLTNTPGVLTETTADLVWALILATARRIVEGSNTIKHDRWTTWSPMFLTGYDVFGATLGIVGAGQIGAAVARRAVGFNMPIIYHNRRPAPEFEADVGARYRQLAELLREADIVVVLVPLTNDTRGMFGAREFALMKPTSIFINAARGPIVKENDLVAALQGGRPWAAGLDVFEQEPIGSEHPLAQLPNATIVPHIGSATVRTRTLMATTAARNLVAALTGANVPNPVNPEVLPLGIKG